MAMRHNLGNAYQLFSLTVYLPFSMPDSSNSFFCSSKTKYDLARHEATHFDKKLYCEVEGCPYECKTLAALRGHIKVVHEV